MFITITRHDWEQTGNNFTFAISSMEVNIPPAGLAQPHSTGSSGSFLRYPTGIFCLILKANVKLDVFPFKFFLDVRSADAAERLAE